MPRKGFKQTEEHKKNISLGRLKRKEEIGYLNSPKTRKLISIAKLGKHHTEKTKEKLRIVNTGKKQSEESIRKRNKTRKKNGWFKNPEEHSKKMSIVQLGKKPSEETTKKRIESRRKNGWFKTPEKTKRLIGIANSNPSKKTRKLMSIARIGTKLTEKTKRNIGLAQLGEKNHSWLGGKSFEPYGFEFNNIFKRRIRKRDNQICMLCNIHREKLNRALCVHHIDYNKLLTLPQNCLSLCDTCHLKTNTNREAWTKFFQSLLSEKYGYQYSEKGEIVLEVEK